MTTTVDIDQVTAFATAVRRSLIDLGPDTLDELTDGLEADLADKFADGEPLGDAAAYAAELRAAAGVAPATHPSIADNVRANLSDLRTRVAPFLRNPLVVPVLGFFVALRPLWWIARAVVLFALVNAPVHWSAVPDAPMQVVLLVALIVASVQWGRGRWLPWKWSRPALAAASTIAVLMSPVVIGTTQSQLHGWWYYDTGEVYVQDGVLLNGAVVTNIFAFGADGQPLTDVRLYDQNGDALSVIPDSWDQAVVWDDNGDGKVQVPSDQVTGFSGWNVFPLDTVRVEDVTLEGTVPQWAKRQPAVPPFASVQQLLGYEPSVEEGK